MDHPCPPSPGSFSPQLSHLVFGHFYCERQKNNFHPFLTPVSMKLFPYVRYLEQLQSSFYKSLQQKASVETSTPIGRPRLPKSLRTPLARDIYSLYIETEKCWIERVFGIGLRGPLLLMTTDWWWLIDWWQLTDWQTDDDWKKGGKKYI